jgi:hypothetical protein
MISCCKEAFGGMGRYEEMISCCKEATKIDPKYAPAWYNMGRAFQDGLLVRYSIGVLFYYDD